MTLQWDPSPDGSVVGYVVFVGTASGSYSEPVNVGDVSSFVFSDAVAGQDYYFSVAAYASDFVVGPLSAEVSGRVDLSTEVSGGVDATPLLVNPGDQTSIAGQWTWLQLVATDSSGAALGYDAIGLPPGMALDSTTGVIEGTPSEEGTFAVTVAASNGVAYAAEAFLWTIQPATNSPTGGWRLRRGRRW